VKSHIGTHIDGINGTSSTTSSSVVITLVWVEFDAVEREEAGRSVEEIAATG
jgi:hypothetical protein